MAEALVNPDLLRWARERTSMPIGTLADKLKTKTERVLAWETGEAHPTFKQAEKIAKYVHIPFGFLFLPAPPEEELPIPDLRTQIGAPKQPLSSDFMDLLRDVMFQHDWYRQRLVDLGIVNRPFVEKFSFSDSAGDIAADIRNALQIHPGNIPSRNWEDHLGALFDRCEALGIWVMRTGYVGSNTHRTLSVSEFRGFAIADKIAPMIFINGRDAKAAQAFTLAHEVAHIWLGKSGISNPFLARHDDDGADVERLCNAIAADVLVPQEWFQAAWNNNESLEHNAQVLSRECKVSQVVMARRARDLGKITWDQYHAFFEQQKRSWPQPGDSSGGNFYATAPIKNGRRFTRAVLSDAMSGNILLRDAGTLLHMKPATVKKLHNRLSQEK